MLEPQTTAPPKKAIDLLRDELLAKLTDEWSDKWAEKHGQIFGGINNVSNQEAFLEALGTDICNIIKQTHGVQISKNSHLSNDTLLRFFNERYGKSFATNTRNVLAMYAEYDSFADFQRSLQASQPAPVIILAITIQQTGVAAPEKTVTYELPRPRLPAWFWPVVLFVPLLIGAGYYYLRTPRPARTLAAADASLLRFAVAAQSNTHNPTQVTFNYDFSQLYIDTLTIYFGGNKGIAEQDFVRLTKPVGTYTFDFYKPGLHLIDVKYGQQVLKRVPIYVRSHGWACWYQSQNWINTNLAYHRFYKSGGLFLHPDELPNASHRNDYSVEIQQTQPFAIQTDSLTVEYDLKYSPDEYAISCYSHLLDLGFADSTRFVLDFSRAGCQSFTPKNGPPRLNEYGYSLAFSRLFYNWAHLKLQWKDRRLRLWVNGELLTNSPNNVPTGRLIDFGLYSKGSAMYDNVRISNSYTGRTVFSDNFDTIPKSVDGY